jgi:asparaginyl-tRNA synthetase
MLPKYLKDFLLAEDRMYAKTPIDKFKLPEFTPQYYWRSVANSPYFQALISLRHHIKIVTDYYFGVCQKAKNVDLFLMTTSASSPMAPGSDSEVIPLNFGRQSVYLADSAQFGFEPILLNNLKAIYCYLPSFRGEDHNKRHLNQFYLCEAEIKGTLDDIFPLVEGYVKILCEALILLPNIINRISVDPQKTNQYLRSILREKEFKKITFDAAADLLIKKGSKNSVNITKFGRDITSKGETDLMKIMKRGLPVWIKNYDRDRVAFYQKPDPLNREKVLNADLIFPPIIAGAFGGEIVGSGQRQDQTREIKESLRRQNINPAPYNWYIKLRQHPNYSVTSGFGLGIERFIAWALGRSDIKDVILYPRLKNIKIYP